MGKVKILPERVLSGPLVGAELDSYRKQRGSEIDSDVATSNPAPEGDLAQILQSALQCRQTRPALDKVCRFVRRIVGKIQFIVKLMWCILMSSCVLCNLQRSRLWSANLTWWPPWVYKQYDAVRHFWSEYTLTLLTPAHVWDTDETKICVNAPSDKIFSAAVGDGTD